MTGLAVDILVFWGWVTLIVGLVVAVLAGFMAARQRFQTMEPEPPVWVNDGRDEPCSCPNHLLVRSIVLHELIAVLADEKADVDAALWDHEVEGRV